MVWRLANNELKIMWEKAVVDTRFRYHGDISLEGLTKMEEDLSTAGL